MRNVRLQVAVVKLCSACLSLSIDTSQSIYTKLDMLPA